MLFRRDLLLHQPNYIYMFRGGARILVRGVGTSDKISYMISSQVLYFWRSKLALYQELLWYFNFWYKQCSGVCSLWHSPSPGPLLALSYRASYMACAKIRNYSFIFDVELFTSIYLFWRFKKSAKFVLISKTFWGHGLPIAAWF